MLRHRLIAAACIIFPTLFVLWLDVVHNFGHPGIWLAPLALLVSQLACAETLNFVKAQGLPVSQRGTHLAALLVLLCSLAPVMWIPYPDDCLLGKPGWAFLSIGLAFCVLVIDELCRFRVPGSSITRIANSLFVVIYAGGMMAFVVQLRLLDPSRLGILALVGTLVVVKLSDAGAYFAGRAFGQNKMAPVLSPGKTWEGMTGGVITACAGAAFVFYLLGPWLLGENSPNVSVWICCLYGVCIAAAGVVGDLFESMLKRDSEVKDSSRWMLGLGGVLDVLDSVLSAAPVSYVWWVSGLIQ